MLKSRITNYFNAKYSWLHYIKTIGVVLTFFIWIIGICLVAYLLAQGKSTNLLPWLLGWTIGGILTFAYSFWWEIGTQSIEMSGAGIKVTKTLGPIRFSKLVQSSKINSLNARKYEPFNPFTGNTMELENRLGWLVINNEPQYFIRSYLYDLNELNRFIGVWKQKHG